MIGAFGQEPFGAYRFAWGLGFFQLLLEFGMSSALQREVSDRWTRGDKAGVDRAITCGSLFYAVIALIQSLVLMGIAYGVMPFSKEFSGSDYDLIIKLLWIQILTSPSFGIGVVLSSILQAARRYEVLPRFEFLIVAARFGVLVGGIALGAGLLTIVIAQTVLSMALSFGPALWVIRREVDYRPRFVRVGLRDFRGLAQLSAYMFLIQLSVVLADKVDTTILGFVLGSPAVAVYTAVSSPFLQLRQMGWTLAYFVMPAVASLAAAGDREGLDRVTYDGARLHSAFVLAVGLLAFLYAGPFLELWVGPKFPGEYGLGLMSSVNDVGDIPTKGVDLVIVADVQGVLHFRIFDTHGQITVDTDETQLPDHDASKLDELKSLLAGLSDQSPVSPSVKTKVIDAATSIVGHTLPGKIPQMTRLMRLFLVAAIPLLIAVHVQVCTGLGKLAVVAVAAIAGAAVNLPLSYVLTRQLGVAGVIWGTVLTTLFSNFLVPIIYTFKVLEVRPAAYLRRTLLAPAVGASLMVSTSILLERAAFTAAPSGDDPVMRMVPFVTHLGVGCASFVAGYALIPAGRSDLQRVLRRFRKPEAPA